MEAGRIRLLPDDLINRIAAGEVVERPGSVLKELVENSLDAGADRIEVECEQGGKRLIRVTDNGTGMDEDELVMSLRRHATSKLDPESDLMDIRTLGFRGEALPAIASVSRMTVTTSRGGAEGRQAVVEGGRMLSVSPAPRNRGTTVEVRDLFFNTPARRKFLKTVQTEEGHLADACQRYALSRPETAITLTMDGREALRASPGDGLGARIREAAGYMSGSLADFRSEDGDGILVYGSVTGPEATARSGAGLFVFVCGRPVKDRLLTRAVIQGYGRTMPPGRFPAGAVFIEVDPSEVDVNVHPAKTEVRFRRPGTVFTAVSAAVARAVTAPPALAGPGSGAPPAGEDALPDDDWGAAGFGGEPDAGSGTRGVPARNAGGGAPEGGGDNGTPGSGSAVPRSWSGPQMPLAPADAPSWLRPASGPEAPGGDGGIGTAGAGAPAGGAGAPGRRAEPPTGPGSSPAGQPDPSGEDGFLFDPGTGADWDESSARGRAGAGEPLGDGGPDGAGDWTVAKVLDGGPPGLRPLAQLARTYILAEAPDGLRIIDQHAAHERILFNRLKMLLERDGLPSRNVLLPDAFDLHPHERAALERVGTALEHLGFRLEPFGEGTWVLKGIPRILTQKAAAEALREILSGCRGSFLQLDGAGAGETVKDVSEAWLHSVACRAAIKAGHDLTREDMERLLKDMYEAEAGGYCPHGRPSSLSVTFYELEKKFGRKK
ncbi:MAG: DNA mismatch repair endonuclease MutL [Deltaproteobacteria bacterium]|jgi:DNA mismatch repair protein MutL|nr:DNA mismatch repair endonuclease MutL [Deltaproteobacteria bacterium]